MNQNNDLRITKLDNNNNNINLYTTTDNCCLATFSFGVVVYHIKYTDKRLKHFNITLRYEKLGNLVVHDDIEMKLYCFWLFRIGFFDFELLGPG